MRRATVCSLALVWIAVGGGCIGPVDRRPGWHLTGESAAPPSDWSFSDAHREIALETHAPWGLPHSVTIWCASVDGRLFVAARAPETKRWPGWVEARPEVRLRIDGRIYPVRLVRLEDPQRIERVRAAYAAKYDLPAPGPDAPPIRYWRVDGRGEQPGPE